MRIEAQRPSSRGTDLTPKRRRNLPETPCGDIELALRLGPGGVQETIPLTREILLNPSFDVQIMQNPGHDHQLRRLAERLEPFLRARGLVVHSDVGLNWPGVRTISPDLSVIENIPKPKPGEATPLSIDVTGECRVRTIFEVVSSGKLARWKDEEKNPPFCARRGVEEYVLRYLPELRKSTDPPLRVFADPRAAGYATELSPNAEGFFELRSIGVRIGVESRKGGDETVVVLDARTGERLADTEEALQRTVQAELEKQQETEARRKAELETQKETEARRKAELETQKETKARRKAELETQQETKARRKAELETQKMAAEIERLRAQLRDAGS
jgi:hypothetical protein